jgi:hypothetical protein
MQTNEKMEITFPTMFAPHVERKCNNENFTCEDVLKMVEKQESFVEPPPLPLLAISNH